jgi:ribosomal protein S12 methylthiotransferase
MKPIKQEKINIITLGCSKNLVDTETLMKQIAANKIKIVHNEDNSDARTVIINTCGFIADAKEESVNTILSHIRAKEEGIIDSVYVMGCLSERYKEELEAEMPEVDAYFGVYDQKQIIESLQLDYKKNLIGEQLLTTPKHYAYLKISEGCDRTCSFCAIPLFKGKHKSVEKEILIKNATQLVKGGVKELMLIAQDLTYYGIDIYKKNALYDLLMELSDINGLEWIRLHYAYPGNFPFEILDAIKERSNICKYIDIPIQHISDNVLRNMRRAHTASATRKLIQTIREKVPEMAIRTTMLVGHPGEEERDFEELLRFTEESKFDRLGVFTYSTEEGTYGYSRFADTITQEIKQSRADKLMDLQQGISFNINQKRVGETHRVIIDRKEKNHYIGRTQFDSPDVDNEVILNARNLKPGEFYQARIIGADSFELFAEIAE